MTRDMSKDSKHNRVKKSETLEVRIPYETKQAFLTACREDGTTASEVVREGVQTYLDKRERPDPKKERTPAMNIVMMLPKPVRRYGLRAAAGGLAAVGLTTFAALPVAAAPDFAAIFKKMDANGDGVLTTGEFLADRQGGDHVRIESKIEQNLSGDQTSATITDGKTEIRKDAIAFWFPEDDSSAGDPTQQVNEIHTQEIRIERRSSAPGAAPSPPTTINVMESQFQAFDTDGNGKVSFAEFQGRHRAMLTRGFEILDSNKDKFLSSMEYAQVANPPIPQLTDDPAIPAAPRPAIPGAAKMTPEKLQAAFAKLDANKDSRLSLQEYLPPA